MPHILFFTGTDRAADASDPKAHWLVGNAVDTRKHRTGRVDRPAEGPHDGLAACAVESESDHGQVQIRTSGVTEQPLGTVPDRSLKRLAVHAGTWPGLEGNDEISPPWAEMFRNVCHEQATCLCQYLRFQSLQAYDPGNAVLPCPGRADKPPPDPARKAHVEYAGHTMHYTDVKRRIRYGFGLVVFGILLATVQGVTGYQRLSAVASEHRAIVFAVETVPYVLISLTLVVIGHRVATSEEFEPELHRIVFWGAGSILLFASVAALLVFSQVITIGLDVLEVTRQVTLNMVTIGAVVGVVTGLYDARIQVQKATVERERDRIEAFANKAADVNNYGRVLHRSETLDEISSLCIEAVHTLLSLTEVAVIEVGDETGTVVDSTFDDGSEDALHTLARASLDQEPTRAVVHESTPEAVGTGNSLAISILIVEDYRDGNAVVLLAHVPPEADVSAGGLDDSEDIQLLELLISHVSTALDRTPPTRH